MTAYVLCVALAAVLGWIHHQLHTQTPPSPVAGTGPRAAAMALASTVRSNRDGAVPVSRAGGPDLGAILVTRPALYHTLTSLYVYHPAPMSQWLTDYETDQAAWCRKMGIQWRGLAQP